MDKHKNALEAAKVIKEYCRTRGVCKECIFGDHYDCDLRESGVPEDWDLDEAEMEWYDIS